MDSYIDKTLQTKPMLETLTQSISEADFTVNRARIIRWLRPFAAATPTFYLIFVIPFALLGYIALLLFPALSVVLSIKLVNSIVNGSAYQNVPDTILQGSLLLLCIVASISVARLNFRKPAGSLVSREKTPELFRLIKKLQLHFGNPKISKILITRDDSVKITHTPVKWLPVKFKNTLEIGMSALLCSSPPEFRGMLAREIAKLASRKNPVTGWMLSLHCQWSEYHHYLERSGGIILKPLTFFFRYYSPLYNAVSFFAARRAEIRSDRYTLEVMEDDDAIHSIIQTIIFQNFLKEKYWPPIMNQPKDGRHRVFLPYKKMSQTVRKNVKQGDINRWVERELQKFGDTSTTLPPLKTRLSLLGHQKPSYPPALEETAAEHYLDTAVQKLLINSFDRGWMRQVGVQP